ncbi:aldolase/citrate lyase family protein, partial [Bordetella pertussis]|uniref:aldolase/citrate lyase family protein n=1 Tax=Bordetella pertussis TaxID=520 RepID=UPI000AB22A3C
ALDRAISACEAEAGLAPGSTEIVPTLESALGVTRACEILTASPRVSACLLAAEDLTASLGPFTPPSRRTRTAWRPRATWRPASRRNATA